MLFTTSIGFAIAITSFFPITISAIPVSSDGCQALDDPTSTCSQPLRFAVLGDSWASGVSYQTSVQYDDNSSGCMRNNQAYGVQLKNDITWAGSNISFDFPACSGSRMIDMAKGHDQIDQLQDPNIIIMTIGGNDIGFFEVVDSCVFLSNTTHDYGPQYENDPGRVGEYAKAIDKAMGYLNDTELGFGFDLSRTFMDLLGSNPAKANPDLRIYQTGYAHYFNVDPGSDWCNEYGFSLQFTGPPLSHALRADMNELVEQANRVIQQVTSSFADQHVGYVSITEGFDGHRFCEPDHTDYDEYYSGDVWYWNLSVPPLVEGGNDTAVPKGTDEPLFDFSNLGNSTDGFKLRPFHPREAGFTAIKEAIIGQLKADKVPGVNS